jgi:hypothetical protein
MSDDLHDDSSSDNHATDISMRLESLATMILDRHSALLRCAAAFLCHEESRGAAAPQPISIIAVCPSVPSQRAASTDGPTATMSDRLHARFAAHKQSSVGAPAQHAGDASSAATDPTTDAEMLHDADLSSGVANCAVHVPLAFDPTGDPAAVLLPAVTVLRFVHEHLPTAVSKRRLRVSLNTQFHLDNALMRLAIAAAAGIGPTGAAEGRSRDEFTSALAGLCASWRSTASAAPDVAGQHSPDASPSPPASPTTAYAAKWRSQSRGNKR